MDSFLSRSSLIQSSHNFRGVVIAITMYHDIRIISRWFDAYALSIGSEGIYIRGLRGQPFRRFTSSSRFVLPTSDIIQNLKNEDKADRTLSMFTARRVIKDSASCLLATFNEFVGSFRFTRKMRITQPQVSMIA